MRRSMQSDETLGGWRDWPLQILEREYSPSSRVPAIGPLLADYAARSAEARRRHVFVEASYGSGDDERIDLFLAAGAPDAEVPAGTAAPLLVYIHGGYWQELSRRDSSFGALQFVPQGVAWAAVGYTLAPRASLAAIIDQCRRAVRWLAANAASLGCDPGRIWLAGSSAGAHLAAMAMLDPLATPQQRPAGAILLSGIYDLRPLVPTYVNRPLALTDAQAWAASPLAADLSRFGDALLAYGENETGSFKAQSRAFGAALRAARPPTATDPGPIEVPARNHFDLVFALGDRSTPLGATLLDRLRGPRAVPAVRGKPRSGSGTAPDRG